MTGNGGGIQHTATVTLTVTAGTQLHDLRLAGFSQRAARQSGQLDPHHHRQRRLQRLRSRCPPRAFPAGTTVSFNPTTIAAPGAGSSTMTVTVGARTPTGTYVITVTGSGGGIVRTVTVSLTVTAQVALSWNASTSQGVVGYNAYRSTTSGGPYTKLNSSLISSTSYTDQMVQSGLTYYYVTTAVNSQGLESVILQRSICYRSLTRPRLANGTRDAVCEPANSVFGQPENILLDVHRLQWRHTRTPALYALHSCAEGQRSCRRIDLQN